MADPISIIDAVKQWSTNTPDKPALIFGERVISYAELWEGICGASAIFATRNIRRGDRVVLSASQRGPEFLFGYLACHFRGVVAVPVDPMITPLAMGRLAKLLNARAAFLSPSAVVAGLDCHELALLDGANGRDKNTECRRPMPGEAAEILFTTGTTGDPKGVVLTHRNIIAATRHINAFIGNGADDIEVVPLPLSHSFGLGRVRCNLLCGATLVVMPGLAFPSAVTRAIHHWRATGLATVPSGIAVLLKLGDHALARYRDQLRYIEIGSAPMRSELKRRLARLLPTTRICMHYGLTEASRSVFMEFHKNVDRLDSVGRPAAGVKIRIADSEGRPVATGETGRILVKGEHVMAGYLDDALATEAVMANGWLVTGDIGRADTEGYLYLTGRESDLINVGGRKVAPLEVERAIMSYPSVADAACVGIPDPKGITGESIKLFLVAQPGEKRRPDDHALRVWLADRIEPHKMPAEYQWIDKIPRMPSGKIRRQLLGREPVV